MEYDRTIIDIRKTIMSEDNVNIKFISDNDQVIYETNISY